jgi:hypothetical protein
MIVAMLIAVANATPVQAGATGLIGSEDEKPGRLISLDQAEGLGRQAAAIKKVECIRAFGPSDVCGCIASALPVQIGMVDYLRIAGMPSGVLQERRKGLTSAEQQIIDQILAARTQCVTHASPIR